MIRAILFDLDGTLLDSAPDFIHCLNKLLEQNDKTKLPDDVIRQHVSDGSIKLIEIGFKIKPSNNDFADLRRQLLDLYDKNLLKWADIFHDVENLINFVESRNILWGVVTNKPSYFSKKILARIPIFNNCAVLVSSDDVKNMKPDPEGISKACVEIGVLPQNVIYVGDHIKDMIAAEKAGCLPIACRYGYYNDQKNDLKQYLYADSVRDLKTKICKVIDERQR